MAEVNPLKLVDQGGGAGALTEFAAGDTLPKAALPTLEVADVSGLSTALSQLYGRDSILGTVSQLAGVPTGAIIERGSNANGDYVRWADGTQICSATFNYGAVSVEAVGNIFADSVARTWNFPAIFSAPPTVSVTGASQSNQFTWGSSNSPTNSLVLFRLLSHSPGPVTLAACLTAIGRWYE